MGTSTQQALGLFITVTSALWIECGINSSSKYICQIIWCIYIFKKQGQELYACIFYHWCEKTKLYGLMIAIGKRQRSGQLKKWKLKFAKYTLLHFWILNHMNESPIFLKRIVSAHTHTHTHAFLKSCWRKTQLTNIKANETKRIEICSCCVLSCSVMSDPLRPHGLQPTRLLCPWDSPDKNTTISFSRGCSRPKDRTRVSCVSCKGRQVLYH